MKIASGTVVEGRVVLEGMSFADGTRVTVLVDDKDAEPILTSEQEEELRLAMEEADRGELVSAEEVLGNLARRHGRSRK